jgi:hypothetical protein
MRVIDIDICIGVSGWLFICGDLTLNLIICPKVEQSLKLLFDKRIEKKREQQKEAQNQKLDELKKLEKQHAEKSAELLKRIEEEQAILREKNIAVLATFAEQQAKELDEERQKETLKTDLNTEEGNLPVELSKLVQIIRKLGGGDMVEEEFKKEEVKHEMKEVSVRAEIISVTKEISTALIKAVARKIAQKPLSSHQTSSEQIQILKEQFYGIPEMQNILAQITWLWDWEGINNLDQHWKFSSLTICGKFDYF